MLLFRNSKLSNLSQIQFNWLSRESGLRLELWSYPQTRGSGLWLRMPAFVRMRIGMKMYSPQIHRLRVICRGSGLWLQMPGFVRMRIGMRMYSPQIHRLRVICRGSGLWLQMPGFVRMRIGMRMYAPQIHRLRVICRGSGLWLCDDLVCKDEDEDEDVLTTDPQTESDL